MNWKEEAAEKLRKLPMMVHAAASIPKELERLELEARMLQSGSNYAERGSLNVRAQENRLLDNMIRRRELQDLQENAERWVAVTSGALGKLTDTEKKVLTKLYVEGEDMQRVCQVLRVERSSLYRCRDAALKKLTLALYGTLES